MKNFFWGVAVWTTDSSTVDKPAASLFSSRKRASCSSGMLLQIYQIRRRHISENRTLVANGRFVRRLNVKN
jgi:hypothetical protein